MGFNEKEMMMKFRLKKRMRFNEEEMITVNMGLLRGQNDH